MKIGRPFSLVAALLAAAISLTCADLLTEPEDPGITLAFTGDTVIVLGTSVRPTIAATLAGGEAVDPRLSLSSSDSSIVDVRGDTLIGKGRGEATVWVVLASSVVPEDAPRVAQRVRVVIDQVVADSASVSFTSLGDTVTLHAVGLDAQLNPLLVPVKWVSSDPAVVRVDSLTGRLRAIAEGSAVVGAIADLDTAAIPVTVQQELVRYAFIPGTLVADALGLTQNPIAVPLDARDNPILRIGLAPTWSIDDPSRGALNTATGEVTSLLNGSTWLRATRGSVSDSLSYVVSQAAVLSVITPTAPLLASVGEQVQLSVRAFDRNAQELQRSFTPAWFSLNPGAIRVDAAGVVTGLAVDAGYVVAVVDASVDTALVTVRNDAASLVVTPDSAVAQSVGDTLVFTATVLNALGNAIPGATVTWRSTDTTVAEVSQTGRAVTLRTGTARVIAQAGTPVDTGIAVVRNVVDDIDIIPAARQIVSLATVDTPAVSITNARGAQLARGSVAWSADDDFIVRVNAQGHVTALDTGSTFVRATSGVLVDSVLYIVENIPASVNIVGPILDTLTALGQTLTYTVEVRNGRNALIANYPLVWNSTDENQIILSTSAGVTTATAVGYGTGVRITAQAGPAADSVYLVPTNPTRFIVDNSVVVVGSRFGTSIRPFARIQDAVNPADAGDTILVRVGNARYAEMVTLNKRLTLLGDSTAWKANGRNPSFLPTIGHDTGAAGILVPTTAPQTIRYLAIRHTLDGAAIDADGSDMTVEWVYVNPPGSVSSRIGRGISIRNSPSGTSIRNVRVRDVRGYGIRLDNVSGPTIQSDSIVGIDSIAGSHPGSGILVVGGGNASVTQNVVRAAQGPQIYVRGATSPVVNSNDLASQNTLIRFDTIDGSPRIIGNSLDLRFQPGDDNQGSAQDNRAGIQLFNSNPPPRGFISSNTFIGRRLGGAIPFGPMDGVYLVNVGEWFVSSNTFISTRYTIRMQDAAAYIQFNRADSAAAFLLLEGSTDPLVTDDTVRTMGQCLVVYSGGPHQVYVDRTLFQDCSQWGAPSVQVGGTGSSLTMVRSRIDVRHRGAPAISFSGSSIRLDTVDIVVTDSASPGQNAPDTTAGAVNIASGSVTIRDSRIVGFGRHYGLRINSGGTTPQLVLERTTITRNRMGMYLSSPLTFSTIAANEVFDNAQAGLYHGGGLTALPSGFWWGDARGPRGSSAAATGDSIAGFPITVSAAAAPFRTGTTAAGLVRVRGSAQSVLRGTTAPKALTVRVVDSLGRPVSGVSVTFTATSGGGNFGGAGSVAVVTNGDGLAEVAFTLGPSAGSNVVTVTGTSTSIGSVTFTLTGL